MKNILIHDRLGSTLGLLDSAGATTTSYSYEPFGATQQTGAASGNASKYTGREDDGTGLYYYRARYYSPTLQRFISEDPIGFAGGINVYAYVTNSPMMFRDPSGLYGGNPLTGTLQIAVSGSGIFGVGTIVGGGGIAIDNSGNVAPYYEYGGGAAAGARLSGGISIMATNASCWRSPSARGRRREPL